MYLILQNVPALDIVGMTAESPWAVYFVVALVLLGLAAFTRQGQLKRR
jgi:hypothetical protein